MNIWCLGIGGIKFSGADNEERGVKLSTWEDLNSVFLSFFFFFF